MKPLKNLKLPAMCNKILPLVWVLIVSVFTPAIAQEKVPVNLTITYHTQQQLPYLIAKAKIKGKGKNTLLGGLATRFYIYNSSGDTLLIASGVTDYQGEMLVYLPTAVQSVFQSTASPHFAVQTTANTLYKTGFAEVTVQKSRLQLDTLEGRKLVVTLLVKNDSSWVPLKGAEILLGVKRLDGLLPINSSATVTTDSLGMVSGDFTVENLPGDQKGGLTLVASIKDNEVVGSVESGIQVPWGAPRNLISNHFFDRTLFARRGQSPIWLEVLAYSMIVLVWGVVIYLLFQLRKIIQIGKSATLSE